MCTEFIEAVRECFKEFGFIQTSKEGDEVGGTFLVGYKDRLFRIDCDFQIAENMIGMDAVGSGGDFALGALFVMSEHDIPAQDKILMSLQASEFLSIGVSAPFVILNT